MLSIIIFSKNRAMQLCSLIDSIKLNFEIGLIDITAICNYDPDHEESLADLTMIHDDVSFVKEENFKNENIELLKSAKNFCMYLVDDIIITNKVDVRDIISIMSQNPRILNFSLRLGLNLRSCYTLRKNQAIPDGSVFGGKYFVWKWREGDCDWCYPMSVDGHIFRSEVVKQIATLGQYNNPNSFESMMHDLIKASKCPDLSACYIESRLINIPVNKVQDYNNNHCGDVGVEELLSLWESGKKIEITKYYQRVHRAAHEELEIHITER